MASYGSISGINALAPAIGDISESTTPNTTQAEGWLTEGYTYINNALSAAGYVVPVARTVLAFPALSALNNLYATAYALRARGLDAAEGKGESRSEAYLKDFFSRLKTLAEQDLTAQGLTLRPTGTTRPPRRGIRSMQLRRVDGYSATAAVVNPYSGPSE